MGKRFHNNSTYIFILRIFILGVDLFGINFIFELILWMFGLSDSVLFNQFSKIDVHVILSLTWFFPSLYFKTYEGNLKIAYNLRNSVYQLFVQIFLLIVITKIIGNTFFDYLFFSYYAIFSLAYLPISRYAVAFYLNKLDNYFPIRKRATIIGAKPMLSKVQEFLESDHSGFRLIKLGLARNTQETKLQYILKAIEKAKELKVDIIYSFVNLNDEEELKEVLVKSEMNYIKINFIKDFTSSKLQPITINKESDIPIIESSKIPLDELDNRIRKRLFDIIVSLLVISFILSWLWPILAILIRIDSKGAAIFKQIGTGRNNQTFICYKFRTMIVNSASNTQQTLPNDSRMTRIGKILRKTNLDELPQFLNVLKGEMSIIGPRPHMVFETNQYESSVEFFTKRHFIKPGISGWAQINGLRGNLDKKMMEVRVQYDLDYMNNWNFWVDLDILIKTIILTVTGDENAY